MGFCIFFGSWFFMDLIVFLMLLIVFWEFFFSLNFIVVIDIFLLMVELICWINFKDVMLFLIFLVILFLSDLGVVFGKLVDIVIIGKFVLGRYCIGKWENLINFVMVINIKKRIEGIGLLIVYVEKFIVFF